MGTALNQLFSFLVGLQQILLIPLMRLKFPAILSKAFQIMITITLFDPYPQEFLSFAHGLLNFKDTL